MRARASFTEVTMRLHISSYRYTRLPKPRKSGSELEKPRSVTRPSRRAIALARMELIALETQATSRSRESIC